MKKLICTLFILALIISPMVLMAGSDKCKNELKEVQTKIVELEKENAELKIIIEQYKATDQEIIKQLEESNALLEQLNDENISLRTLNDKYKADIKVLKYKWQFGGGINIPTGIDLYVSRVFNSFGLFGTVGGNTKSPYNITIGAYIKK